MSKASQYTKMPFVWETGNASLPPKAALSEASQYKDACCLRSRKGGQKSPHFGVTGSISLPPVASWSGKCGETSLGVTQLLSVCGLSRCRTILCISLEYQYISPLLYWHFIFWDAAVKDCRARGGLSMWDPWLPIRAAPVIQKTGNVAFFDLMFCFFFVLSFTGLLSK